MEKSKAGRNLFLIALSGLFLGHLSQAAQKGHGSNSRVSDQKTSCTGKSGGCEALAPVASPCGTTGSVAARIKNCATKRVLANGSTLTTVSVEVVGDKVVKKYDRDDSTGNIWSPRADHEMGWREAIEYCKNLNKLNPPPLGLKGWHLPIEEKAVVGAMQKLGLMIPGADVSRLDLQETLPMHRSEIEKAYDKHKSEFLAAFGNSINEQAGENELAWPRNFLLLEAFPELVNDNFLWTSSPYGERGSTISTQFGALNYGVHDDNGTARCVTRDH